MATAKTKIYVLSAAFLFASLQPAFAADIGVGADRSVWMVTEEVVGTGGKRIVRWKEEGWANVEGQAVRIDVGPDGRAWIVDLAGTLSRLKDPAPEAPVEWETVRQATWDVGVGADGSVWILALEAPPSQTSGGMALSEGDYKVYRKNGETWESVPGGGSAIDVDPSGTPWVVTSAGSLYRYNISSQTWSQIAAGIVSSAVDVGIGSQSATSGNPSVASADGTVQRCRQAGGIWSCSLLSTSPSEEGLRVSAGLESATAEGDVPWIVSDSSQGAYVWHRFKSGTEKWAFRSLQLEDEDEDEDAPVARAAKWSTAGASPTCDLLPGQKLNDVFQKMSHNTYCNGNSNCTFNQPASVLTTVLDSGVRALEIDFYDQKNAIIGGGGRNGNWYVRHDLTGGNKNHCGAQGQGGNLSDCLADLRRWHDANPDHTLVTVFLDKKQAWSSTKEGRTPKDLDDLITQKIGAANLYRPSNLLAEGGGHPNLAAAALANAWPAWSALDGKFLFILTGGGYFSEYKSQEKYITSRGTDAVLFACPKVTGTGELWVMHDAVCANFEYDEVTGTILGKLANDLGFLSHFWDIPQTDQGYRSAIEQFAGYIGLDDYTASSYNGGRMSGGYWCSGRPAWVTLGSFTSDGRVRSGQKHRSSDNFDINPPARTMYLVWEVTGTNGVPKQDVKLRVKHDQTGWWDSDVFAGTIRAFATTFTPIDYKKLYFADPENTNGESFTVTIKAVVPLQ